MLKAIFDVAKDKFECLKLDEIVQDDGERTVQTSYLTGVGLSIYCSKTALQLIYLALQYSRLNIQE